jgi:xylan 1,4-beta-xylosidase
VWCPALPIYHSKDLVNWKLSSHATDRPDIVDFDRLPDKLGLLAPTILYYDRIFYIVNTCVAYKMNFHITATDPADPWSDPIWLPEAEGIDPSLFWEDDWKCYYTGMKKPKKKQWKDQCMIYNQELDLQQQKLVGKKHILTYGHANNASDSEGPHLYKIKDKYILMISEGGTGVYHALTVHHSDSINGSYISDYINPVLLHRQFG